jgi:TolA-binding protein
MKHSPDSPEDLLVLARRGGLSSQQVEQLQQGLRGSSTLRAAYDVGRAFDQIAEVHEGDEQLITAAVDRVIDRASPSPARAPRSWRYGLIAAIVFGSASAMGYWGVHGWSPREATGEDERGTGVRATDAPRSRSPWRAGAVSARPSEGNGRASAAAPDTAEPSASSSASGGDPTPNGSHGGFEHVRGLGATTATNSTVSAEATPGAVFSAANAARRVGRQDRAIALYLELQRKYPSSAEASLSHVSLGRLLLSGHQLQAALQQFSTYLRGGGPLEEEALLGKAQTLAALGRRQEEGAAWRALLARYPHSVYAAEARERIGTEQR